MRKVALINCFSGNLFSASKAFESFNCDVCQVGNGEEALAADFLVLPGVGAFADGMNALRVAGMVEPIRAFIDTGRPFLGICLGMQALFDSSEEFGLHKGLGLVEGKVLRLPAQPELRIPHIGWRPLCPPEGKDESFWKGTILANMDVSKDMYFVHSFAAQPKRSEDWLSRTSYGASWFCSSVRKGNVWGCQFHPEKSGAAGRELIRRFLEL
jgi:imidazole glycerol-phosphate synthase subunit HisH